MNGYNLNWVEKNNKKQNASNSQENNDKKENDNLNVSTKDTIPLIFQITPIFNFIPDTIIDSLSLRNGYLSNSNFKIRRIHKYINIYKSLTPIFGSSNKKSDTKRNSKMSLIFGAIALGLVLLASLILLGIVNEFIIGILAALAVLFLLIILIIAGVFSVISFIQGLIAINKIKNNPDDKSYKKDAMLGLIFGAISLLIFLALITLLLFFLSTG